MVGRTPRPERYCHFCKLNDTYVVEDEIHFLLTCPLYQKDRRDMLEQIFSKFPSNRPLGTKNLFIWLLCQEDNICLRILANYCNSAFYERTKNLN